MKSDCIKYRDWEIRFIQTGVVALSVGLNKWSNDLEDGEE